MMFVCCTLLPLMGMSILSYSQVASQLREQSNLRLRQAAKTQGMAILERLGYVEIEMQQIAADLADHPNAIGANKLAHIR